MKYSSRIVGDKKGKLIIFAIALIIFGVILQYGGDQDSGFYVAGIGLILLFYFSVS